MSLLLVVRPTKPPCRRRRHRPHFYKGDAVNSGRTSEVTISPASAI